MKKYFYLLSFFLLMLSSMASAVMKPDSLLLVLKNTKDDKNKVDQINHLYRYYSVKNNLSPYDTLVALGMLNDAIKISKKIGYGKGEVESLTNKADFFRICDLKKDKAKTEINKLFEIARNEKLTNQLSAGYIYSAMLFPKDSAALALIQFNKVIDLARKKNDKLLEGEALFRLADYEIRNEIDTSKVFSQVNSAVEIFNAANDNYYSAFIYTEISRAYNDVHLNNYSIQYSNTAFSSAKNFPPKEKLNIYGKVYYRLAYIYSDQYDFPNTIKNYQYAIDAFEKIDDTSSVAVCYAQMGWVYSENQQYDVAIQTTKKALLKYEQLKDDLGSTYSLSIMGSCYNSLSKFEPALEYYQKTIVISKKYNDQATFYYSLTNISDVYLEIGKYEEALKNNLLCLEYYKKQNDEYLWCYNASALGAIYSKFKKYDKSIEYLIMSLKTAEKINAIDVIKSDYDALKEVYAAKGDFKTAYAYYNTYSTMKDSIYTSETAKSMTEMQTKYETEKKESEITLLTKDKALQDAEINTQRLVRIGLLIGLGIFLILIVVIYNRYRLKQQTNKELETKNTEITKQKGEIEHKNIQITSSIKYAKNIQEALFPSLDSVKQIIPESFIFFQPKDIVSGDFYWVKEIEDKVIVAAVDCTGHGVPGAFMSVMGINLLETVVNSHPLTTASEILNKLNKLTVATLKQTNEDSSTKDGMDIALVLLDRKKNEMQFAGAHNSMYLISNGELKEITADKMPIGISYEKQARDFTNNMIPIQKGDIFYLFSDGFVDQKGGPKNKKFFYQPFKDLLQKNAILPVEKQHEVLQTTINEWINGKEQMDDILVMGMKI